MFLFLSKLLPLFLYPLGMSCLLMLVAFVLLWRRPRLAAIPLALALIVLLAGSSSWVSDGLMRSLEFQNLPPQDLPKADAIVVLGGATKPADPPRPWVEVSDEGDRLFHALKLYREGKAPRIILSGGRIDWQGAGGPPESSDMAELLEAMGIPKSAILQDPTSLNTRQNAVNVKQIMDQQGIRKILLITSASHMPRSLLIFKRLGIDAIAAPTDFATISRETERTVESTLLSLLPSAEKLKETTRALKEYVGILVYRLRGWA